jgi:anaerobic dimethyl sulfoxide reductase subunit C (anchor subunit)
MINHDWPLMAFTLLMQFSAGIVLIYNIFLVIPLAIENTRIPTRFNVILGIACTSALAGIIFSFLHMGTPSNAIKTLANLNRSWLSKEILMVMVFSGLLLATAIHQILLPARIRLYKVLVMLTTLAGVVLMYVMTRIYQLPAVPAWNSIFTPAGFFLAMLLSGSSLILLFQLTSGSWAAQKGLTILIMAAATTLIVLMPLQMSWLDEAGPAAKQSLNLLLNDYLPAFYLRLGLEIITLGAGIWAFFSIKSDTLKPSRLFIPSLTAFLGGMAAIIIDRFLFYVQHVPAMGL